MPPQSFGSGTHPGFTNLMSIVGSQMCETVDRITVTESVFAEAAAMPAVNAWAGGRRRGTGHRRPRTCR